MCSHGLFARVFGVHAGLLLVLAGCSRPADDSPPRTTLASSEHVGTAVAAVQSNPPPPSLSTFAVYATESVSINASAVVTGGDVGVAYATGPFLSNNVAASLNSGASLDTSHTLYADSVLLNSGATLGAVDTNHLTDHGSTHGTVSTLPAMPSLPTPPTGTAGSTNVTVNSGTRTLAAGSYGAVTINSGTIQLSGGTYVVASLTLNSNATLLVEAASTVIVTGSSVFNSGSFTGPASGTGLTAKSLQLDSLSTSGSAFTLNSNAEVHALVLATKTLVTLNSGDKFYGAIAAAQVNLNSGATVTFQDGFGSTSCATSCDDGNACTTDACVSGACTHTSVANGTSCNDGNACTQTDTCQSGTCTGSNPVTCIAADSCHVAGTCNTSTGVCTTPTAADGTSCNDGNACTQSDSCQSGTCTGSNPVTCTAADSCHVAGTCNTSTGVCTTPAAPNGTSCNDGNACTQTDTCVSGTCTGSNPVTCSAADSCHVAGTCNATTGVCTTPTAADGTSCNDGNACTQTDSCRAGTCTGSNPVTCTAADSCHVVGTCNATTGACTSPAAPNGTSCNDGNACTQTDTCVSGTCTGSNPITCSAADSCHVAGTCNTSTGACTSPAAPNGTSCNDGNACTQTDSCVSGTCTGSNPITCTAADSCHVAGTCNATTGACTTPAAPNGTSCNDGNACTQTDSCVSGTCTGSNPITCTAADSCHVAGTCNTSTGACTSPAAPNGTSCNDGNACTQSDRCQSGTCTGSNPVTCAAVDSCHVAGTCNASTGACSSPTAPDGTACNDGNACTQTDSCQSGTCTGANPVTCAAADSCHVAGTCNATTGACTTPAAPNGTSCNDGNACTQTDTCQSGACTGSNPVTCTAADSCHVAGTCNTSTGSCTTPAAPNGTSCNDGDACTQTDSCQSGTCTGSNPVTCTAADSCHVAGTCNTSTGACTTPTAPDGMSCNDGNACTQTDSCQAGTCTGANAVTCTASDACHVVGTCNAATGACSNPQIVLPPSSGCTLSTCDPLTGPAEYTCAPIDRTATSTIVATASFLYSGSSPIQSGVAAGTIVPTRAAVLRGQAFDVSGAPLAGLSVTIVGHPELGTTTSLSDGTFSIAANGGSPLTVSLRAARYLPVQRTVLVPWNQYVDVPSVTMTALDPVVTTVSFTGSQGYAVARGTPQTDDSGTRTATLLFPPGTTATLVTSSGSSPATTLSIRATEYTVGPNGPSAMPGTLPKTSAYTYAVELSADEAFASNGSVQFSAPIISYTDNFLGFSAGQAVPVGTYDPTRGVWVPMPNGLVIAITAITGGVASIDITGDGVADSQAQLSAAGITSAEQAQLATLYATPTSLWRVPIPHFSTWDFNWPFGPKPGSTPPNASAPAPPAEAPLLCPGSSTATSTNASSIECQNEILHETLPIAGTPYNLVYSSDRVPGYTVNNRLLIPLSGATIPDDLASIDLEVDVGGRTFTQSFAPSANASTTFDWDGNDAFGRLMQGAQMASVAVGFTYPGVYLTPSENPNGGAYDAIFGHFSYYGAPATADPTRQTVTIWSRSQMPIGHWDARPLGLGGWTLDVQHVYEPATETLRRGDGGRQPGDAFGKVATTFAGTGSAGFGGDNGPATSAQLNNPWNVSVMPDGSVLIADRQNYRIRKVSTSGIITTVAGTGAIGYNGDNQNATNAQLNNPESVVAAPDGSFYIADVANQRIRHVDTNGIITTVAGNGSSGYSGDGGTATSAQLANPNGLFVASDGSIYIADSVNCVIRKVDAAGLISTVAGTGSYGYSGDGGPATKAQLSNAHAMVVTPDGELIISDRENNRIRKVGVDGIINTIAGNGSAGFSGDGGPASQATLSQPQNIVLGADGTLYFADHDNVRIRTIRSDGIITTIAGTGAAGFTGENGPALEAAFNPGQFIWGLALSGDGQYLYIGDGSNYRVRRLQLAQPGFNNTLFAIASQNGAEVYGFDALGRHLTTTTLPTNAPKLTLGYDASGLVHTLTDVDGNVTTIARDGSGNPTSITSPFGVTTTLALGSDGYLAAMSDPTGAQWQMSYANGLLTSIAFPTGSPTQASTKTYDASAASRRAPMPPVIC